MKLKAVAALFVLTIGMVFALDDLPENLMPSKVSAASLKPWVEAAKYVVTIDDDGDLKCETPDNKFFITVDSKREIIKMFALWNKPKQLDIRTMKILANDFSEDTIFAKVTVDSEGDAAVRYFMVYTGGLNRKNFMESLDWFLLIDKGWQKKVREKLDD